MFHSNNKLHQMQILLNNPRMFDEIRSVANFILGIKRAEPKAWPFQKMAKLCFGTY